MKHNSEREGGVTEYGCPKMKNEKDMIKECKDKMLLRGHLLKFRE